MPVVLSHVEDPKAWWVRVVKWWIRRCCRAWSRQEDPPKLMSVAAEVAALQCVWVPPREGYPSEQPSKDEPPTKKAKVHAAETPQIQDNEGAPKTRRSRTRTWPERVRSPLM